MTEQTTWTRRGAWEYSDPEDAEDAEFCSCGAPMLWDGACDNEDHDDA